MVAGGSMSVDVCSENTLPPYFSIEQGTESGWDVNLKASSDFSSSSNAPPLKGS